MWRATLVLQVIIWEFDGILYKCLQELRNQIIYLLEVF